MSILIPTSLPPVLDLKRSSAPPLSHKLSLRNHSHQPSSLIDSNTPLKPIKPNLNLSTISQEQNLKQAEVAIQKLSQLDQSFLNAYQQMEQQSQYQQYANYFNYQQQMQQQQLQQQALEGQRQLKARDDHQNQIRFYAQKELAKVIELTKYLKETKLLQNQQLSQLRKEQQDLSRIREKVEQREKSSDQYLLKIDAERENLKTLHKLIDSEEEKVKYSKSLVRGKGEPLIPNYQKSPYQDLNLSYIQPQDKQNFFNQPQKRCSCNHNIHTHHTPQISKTAPSGAIGLYNPRLNNSFIQQKHHSSCLDCGITIDTSITSPTKTISFKKDYYDTREQQDTPVFELGSVLDWLDHRREQTRRHQEQIVLKQKRNLKKLEEMQQEKDKKRDWASERVSKLGQLIKYK